MQALLVQVGIRYANLAVALQAWKEQLYPLLKQHLAENVDSSIAYLVLYHEAAVANLLEVRPCSGMAPSIAASPREFAACTAGVAGGVAHTSSGRHTSWWGLSGSYSGTEHKVKSFCAT